MLSKHTLQSYLTWIHSTEEISFSSRGDAPYLIRQVFDLNLGPYTREWLEIFVCHFAVHTSLARPKLHNNYLIQLTINVKVLD
jgi:hypothetical protein